MQTRLQRQKQGLEVSRPADKVHKGCFGNKAATIV